MRGLLSRVWESFNTVFGWALTALILTWAPSLAIIFFGDAFTVDGSTKLTMMVPIMLTALTFEAIRLQARIVARTLAVLYLGIVVAASIALVGLIWAPSAFMMFVAAMSLDE